MILYSEQHIWGSYCGVSHVHILEVVFLIRPLLQIQKPRELVFKDQRGFAMLFNFQISIESVCMKTKTNRINTVLKTEQHSKTTLIFKNHLSSCGAGASPKTPSG